MDVRRTAGGSLECKCLGHPVGHDPVSLTPEEAIVYADNSSLELKPRASVVQRLTTAVAELAQKKGWFDSPGPSVLPLGFDGDDNGFKPPTSELEVNVLKLALAYFWAVQREPLTTISVACNVKEIAMGHNCERMYMLAWMHPMNKPAVYQVCVDPSIATSEAACAISVPAGTHCTDFSAPLRLRKDLLYRFETRSMVVTFESVAGGTYEAHKESLRELGFRLPGQVYHSGFGSALTALGIDKLRLMMLFKTGDDTRAITALLTSAVAADPLLSAISFSQSTGPVAATEVLQIGTGGDEWTGCDFDECSALNELFALWQQRKRFMRGKQCIYNEVTDQIFHVAKDSQTLVTPDLSGSNMSPNMFPLRSTFVFFEPPEERPIPAHVKVGWYRLESKFRYLSNSARQLAFKVPWLLSTFSTDELVMPGSAVLDDSNSCGVIAHGTALKFSPQQLHRIHRHTGIPLQELREAAARLPEYRLYFGLLQRRWYSSQTGLHEYFTVVPKGGWRSVEFQGVNRRLSLRRYVIISHHCAPLGGHKDRDRTLNAITDAGLWWKDLRADIDALIKNCLVCKVAKSRPVVTGFMRSRESDGPFRVLVINFVGPQRPATPRGNEYCFTCACIFSGWYWCIPCRRDDSATAAELFAERIMFDLAGVPAVLSSDRAKAFTESVVKHLNGTFGIKHVLGTSLHPQSPSTVERPHREYRTLCKQFMREFSNNFDVVAPLFQWTVRTSCKVFNGSFTPYEIITGLKPRTPLDGLLSTPTVLQATSVDSYVSQLVLYLRRAHAFVENEHKRVRNAEQELQLRKFGGDTHLAVGDFVLVKKGSFSSDERRKSQTPNLDVVYQIADQTGGEARSRAFVLCDPVTGSKELGFHQPVSADRLVPVQLAPPLTTPIGPDQPRTRLTVGGKTGTIEAVGIDGRVHVKWDHAGTEVLDLTTTSYQWLDG